MDHNDDRRYEEVKKLVAPLGYFCRGTVLRRLMACGKPGCRCQASPPKLHGPYYQWTRKVEGKTVTMRVSATEAKLLRQWIANGRRFDALASKMEQVSLRAIDRALRHLRSEIVNPRGPPQRVPAVDRKGRGGARRSPSQKSET